MNTPPFESEYTMVGDDVVLPFAVEPLEVRGRAVQLGPMLDEIMSRHDYPQDVAFLLSELIVLTTLLGTSLKFEGNFILQTQSQGPVSLAVVDFATPDAVRAYARFDANAVEEAVKAGKASPRELLGDGVMAMTLDQGEHMQRYQGVVALDGISLEEAAHQYFRQSEQIPTLVKLSVAQIMRPSQTDGSVQTAWRAGGMLLQFLPESEDCIKHRDLPDGREESPEVDHGETWREASALFNTISPDELTDPNIGAEQLLFRLFNEHGVRVFEGNPVLDKCSCSRERVIALIRSFANDDDQPLNEESLTTKCEFCSTTYRIDPAEI